MKFQSGYPFVTDMSEKTVLTDYPAKEVLDNLDGNVRRNLPESTRLQTSPVGHVWGDLDDEFSKTHACGFTRIFAADCFWMPWEHHNLARSMLHFLSDKEGSKVYAVAGFHTGRAKLAPFFDVVEEEGLQVEDLHEVDVQGNKRPWAKVRDNGKENVSERKRWLAVAILKRAKPSRKG